MRALAAVLALALGGCALGPSAAQLNALAADPSTVCFSMTTIYGTVRLYRSGQYDGGATCTQDGLTITPSPPR